MLYEVITFYAIFQGRMRREKIRLVYFQGLDLCQQKFECYRRLADVIPSCLQPLETLGICFPFQVF